MRLVLASNNAKKLVELDALLAPLGVALVTQGSLGVGEADEPHVTFIENALAKARHAATATGFAAIADDSGLCVDALGGAPGVRSARFAVDAAAAAAAAAPADMRDREHQRQAQDAANNALLLARLQGAATRRARFVCALVAVRSAEDPEPLIAFGRWEGEVLDAPRGRGGFGYDPLMFIAGLGATVAELPADVKALHSHRAIAVAQMRTLMQQAWGLGTEAGAAP